MKKFMLNVILAVALGQSGFVYGFQASSLYNNQKNQENKEVELYIQNLQQVLKAKNITKSQELFVEVSEICKDPRLLAVFQETMKQMGIQEPVELRAWLPKHQPENMAASYVNADSAGKNMVLCSPVLLNDDINWVKFAIRHELEHHRQGFAHYSDSYHGKNSVVRELMADLEGLKVCSKIDDPCWQKICDIKYTWKKEDYDEQGYITNYFIKAIHDDIKEKQKQSSQ